MNESMTSLQEEKIDQGLFGQLYRESRAMAEYALLSIKQTQPQNGPSSGN